jgi:hypothetical protein
MSSSQAVAGSGMSTTDPAPLEDLMVAMDVVDTLRHRDMVIDRELNADLRRANLRQRLRDIYSAQGIEVTDEALDAGIAALEEERFKYEPPPDSFAKRLATLYVTRNRWGKRARIIGLFAAVVIGVWFFTDVLPTRQLRAELPASIERTYAAIVSSTTDATALSQARELDSAANAALREADLGEAAKQRDALATLLTRLQDTFDVRVVSRGNEASGVWRIPDINAATRNYYLIVEAVSPSGRILDVPVTSEEDGITRLVTMWGVRVSEDTFEAVAADKRDDGIIQDDIIGTKPAGQLQPEYVIAVAGGAITEW